MNKKHDKRLDAPRREVVLEELRKAAPNPLTRQQLSEACDSNYVAMGNLLARAKRKGGLFFTRRAIHANLYFANKEDADAFDVQGYIRDTLKPKSSPLKYAILEVCKGHRLGIKQGAARAALPMPCTPGTMSTTMVEMCAMGMLWKLGPHNWSRYFIDEATMNANRDETLADIEVERAMSRAAAAEREKKFYADRCEALKAATRAKRQANAALRPPKVKQKKPTAPHTALVLRKSTTVPPKKPSFSELPVVIPPHVKVQVCPGFTRDRFAVSGPVIGGFASIGVGRYIE